VEDELLLQGAKKASISVSDDDVEREVRANAEGYPAGTFARMLVAEQLTLEAYRERVRRRLVEESFLRARLAQLPPLTDEEVRARYESTVSKVERPEAVHVRQVLLHTREEASHLLEQIRKKTLSVEVAARKFSAAPEADTGGDLGWFARGELPDAFDECFALDPGTISDVVESKYGFHIFQILERRDAGVEPFESARERIEADLARERQTQLVDTLLVELRRELPVVVNEAALDRVVALLPPATSMPVAPHNETDENSEARALDAHIQSNETLREAPHTGATHRRAETHE
jgi:peptidyl-prolyl cis-trans isomerase C/foldase protein PrsA